MNNNKIELDDVINVHHYISALLQERTDMDAAHHHILVNVEQELTDYLTEAGALFMSLFLELTNR